MSVRVFVSSPEPSLGFNMLELEHLPRVGDAINIVVTHSVQYDVGLSTIITIEKPT